MVRLLAPLLVALMVAGCVHSDSGSSANEDGAEVDPGLGQGTNLNRTFSGKAQLSVSQVNTPANRVGFMGSNCIRFDEGDVARIHQLNATATWQAMTPAQQELELRVYDKGSDHILQGPSPLSIGEQDLEPDGFFEAIFIMVQAPAPAGVTVEQAVDVEYTIIYDGKESPKVQPGGCSFG